MLSTWNEQGSTSLEHHFSGTQSIIIYYVVIVYGMACASRYQLNVYNHQGLRFSEHKEHNSHLINYCCKWGEKNDHDMAGWGMTWILWILYRKSLESLIVSELTFSISSTHYRYTHKTQNNKQVGSNSIQARCFIRSDNGKGILI